MRLLNLSLFLGIATLATASSVTEDDSETQENTYFNQQKVPPMVELTPDTWDKAVKASKFLMVKHFSPYCPHCAEFAPTYQTLYEFYYTSTPSGSGNEDADFTKFYDFKFASINCVAYYDLCSKHNVQSYPTTTIYKDGEELQTFKGSRNLEVLSEAVEAALEKEKPGTRPASLSLPKPGDASTPDGPKLDLKKPSTKETEKDKAPAASASAKTEKADKADKSGKDETSPKSEKQAEKSDKAEKGAKADQAKPTTPIFISNPVAGKKPTKPVTTPNLKGESVKLSAETFQTRVTMTQESWFIKFYAPWCHHCQAMAPNWEQLAKAMEGKLNIGEVNCDAESRLCKDVRLRGYPTILFFKGGERVEYDGLRGVGDLIHYAEKAIDISSGIENVDAAAFEALEAKEEVIFVYFYDHATTTEDFRALERLPLSLIGHAKLVMTEDPALFDRFKITTWPRLMVSREGRPTYYRPLTPNEMRDTHQVLDWMKSVWLPIIPELSASNAREVMDGKLVVLAVLNREDQEGFTGAIRELKTAANEWMDKQIQNFQRERQELRDAKQLRIEEAEDRGDQRALRNAKNLRINMDKSDHKEVAFAWVDGVFWQRWIRTTYGIDVKDGDRNRRYWDQTVNGNYIIPSRTWILETLNKVTASPPKIRPKLTISSFEKIFFDIRVTFVEHPFLTVGCIIGVALAGFSWFRGRMRRTRGHFRLDDSLKDVKAPFLGANTNTKAD
ncbi:thioredoxin-like protein [Thozetella sp. PMI_491]|nr:thioredoxin-like protein [Thozetella sp. PMI_491]